MTLYVVEQRKLWGDYGSVLIGGYVAREGPDTPLLLHRAGPFLPPISLPWSSVIGQHIIVSDEFRRELEAKGFPGLEFRPAVKNRIIEVPWHQWDLTAGEPERYPTDGEPENYIRDKPHDAKVAAQMTDAWELLPPVVPMKIERLQDPQGSFLNRFRVTEKDAENVDRATMFTNQRKWGNLIVAEVARAWLEERFADWVTFCDVEIHAS